MRLLLVFTATLLCGSAALQPSASRRLQAVRVTLPTQQQEQGHRQLLQERSGFSGRVRVYVAATNSTPPYAQSADSQDTAQLFGVDVLQLQPGQSVLVDGTLVVLVLLVSYVRSIL
mgnify:CR=1 FL=1